jgi:Helix-turn-helix of insertion element transposase
MRNRGPKLVSPGKAASRKESETSTPAPKVVFVKHLDLLQVLQNPDFDLLQKIACWTAMPADERKPKTQRELAKLLDVDESEISRQKNRPEFTALMKETVRRIYADLTGGVVASLYSRCVGEKPSLYAMELWFKYIAEWSDPENMQGHNPVTNNIAFMINGKPANQLPVGIVDRPQLKAAGA